MSEETQQPNIPPTPPEPSGSWFGKNKLAGYGFLVIILAVAVWGIYEWQYRDNKDDRSDKDNKSEVCIQVITKARNLETGEIREFPTPCDVPEGWVVVQPDQLDETAGWQTYINLEHWFRVKYPDGWSWSICGQQCVAFYPLNRKYYSPISLVVRLESIDVVKEERIESSNEFLNEEKASFNNLEWTKLTFEYSSPSSGILHEYLIERDGKTYILQDILEVEDISTQIFSTFKFIDIASTDSWQTYTSEEYGFEFKHPSNMAVSPSLQENNLFAVDGENLSFFVSMKNGKIEKEFYYPPQGEVVRLTETFVGSKKWYTGWPGDGGDLNGSTCYSTEIGEKRFTVCFIRYLEGWADQPGDDELYSNKLYSDIEQQKTILSTIKFIN